MKELSSRNYSLYIILILYTLCLGIGLFHHEFWMDESHHWLIARDSTTLIDLFNNYRYDGHPILWVFSLWIIGKITSKLIFVKLLQATIAFIVAYLFLFKSPFKKKYNILFIFSYYPLFEYGMLSRNYALTILFLILFCVSFKPNGKLIIPFLFLGLAANSHLFGLLFSVLVSLKILHNQRFELKKHVAAILLLVFMVAFALITIKAPSDHFFYLEISKLFDFQKIGSITTIWWKAAAPLPDLLVTNFWNTNFFTSKLKIFAIPLILFSWIVPLFFLKRKSGYYLVFYVYALAILMFYLLTGLHISQRIGGFLLFALIVIVWIEKKTSFTNNSIVTISNGARLSLIYGFFTIQIFSAGVFLVSDINRPFSNTESIYNYLKTNVDKGTPIYGGLYCNYIGINNYGDLKMHIISQKNDVKYCDWRILTKNSNKTFLEEGIKLMSSKEYKKMVVLTPDKISDFNFDQYRMKLIGNIGNAMVKNENAYIYEMSRVVSN